jgi:hypothetical protein
MLCGAKMLRGVFVLRGIATSDMTTVQAEAQMNPTVADLETFFAALGLWFNGAYLIDVSAFFGHDCLRRSHRAA